MRVNHQVGKPSQVIQVRPGVVDQADQLTVKLETLDKDFRSIHYEIVDFTLLMTRLS